MSDTGTQAAETKSDVTATERGQRQVLQGVVRSNKTDKTVVVEVSVRVPHSSYRKYVNRRKRFMAHDERNEMQIGDVVRIASCRPLSRRKTWRVIELVQRAV